jgi:hypothetical protein
LNPAHPDAAYVKVLEAIREPFDERLVKARRSDFPA